MLCSAVARGGPGARAGELAGRAPPWPPAWLNAARSRPKATHSWRCGTVQNLSSESPRALGTAAPPPSAADSAGLAGSADSGAAAKQQTRRERVAIGMAAVDITAAYVLRRVA